MTDASSDPAEAAVVVDLTFIRHEVRRVQIADDMWLVWDRLGYPAGVVGYREDGLRWDHLCETVPDPELGRVRKRIAAFLSPGHRITVDDPVTIEGSLSCLSCKLHGHVREGRWVPVG